MIIDPMQKQNRNNSWELAIEISGSLGGLAIGSGNRPTDSAVLDAQARHAAALIPTIAKLCDRQSISLKEIGTVYLSIGPGSFTGLRIAVTAARMLAFAQGARIVTIPSLTVIAQNGIGEKNSPENLVVIRDAKRKNVYAAHFELVGEQFKPRSAPREVTPADFFESLPKPCAICGEGLSLYGDLAREAGLEVLAETKWKPDPAVLFALGCEAARRGDFVDPVKLTPLYVRRPEPEEKWEQMHGK